MTRTFVDQIGEEVEISTLPKRIISVVPSQTELLKDLGLEEEVIGITKFCIHPKEWFRNKTRIGGTKSLNIEKIKGLKPDLILANKEENNKEEIEVLKQFFPIWISDVKTIEDAFQMILQIGEIVGQQDKAVGLVSKLKSDFDSINFSKFRKAAYLIWNKPTMVAGGDTFINSMMNLAGFENVFVKENRYPEKSIQELLDASPEILLLSSEPFPFKEKHILEFQASLPNTQIKLVDGEIFSWYGSRMLRAVTYFRKLIPNL